MKIRNIVCMVVMLMNVVCLSSAQASGRILFLTDWQDIGGEDKYVSEIDIFVQKSETLGLGINTSAKLEEDYTKIKPYLSWKTDKSFNLCGAISTDSEGVDQFYLGISKSLELSDRWSLSLAPQYVFVLSGSDDFIDIFAKFNYHASEKLSLGLELVYDYWPDSGENFALVGPTFSYKLNQKWSVFSRIAAEDGGNSSALSFKLGLNMNF